MKKENQDISKHQNNIEVIELDNNALEGAAGGGSDGDFELDQGCNVLNNVIPIIGGCIVID